MNNYFRFNTLKHHLGSLHAFIAEQKADHLSEAAQTLKTLGGSQMDLYTGELSVAQIFSETAAQLRAQQLLEPAAFKTFLGESGFRSIVLSDTSVWVLRFGEDDQQFVHLHPARYSPHTIRVKASTLKTAVLCSCAGVDCNDRESVSRLRTTYLDLPPLASAGDAQQLHKIGALLR